MSIIVGWNDYDVRFECLNVTLLLVCMFCFIILYWIKKDKVFYLYRALGSELHEYDVGGETLEHINRLRAESKIEKQKIPRINFIMCCSVMLLISFRRPLNYLIKGETRHSRDGADLPSPHFVGGIPIPYWFYVEPKGNLYYPAAFLEYFNILYVGLLFPIIDGSFVAMSHEICTEFKILHYMLRNLVETAEAKYEQSNPNSSINDMNKFQIILKTCLRSCLIHHQQIIKVVSVIRDVNYLLLVLSGFGMGIFTCLLGVVLTVPGTSEALKASSFILILLELVHVYFYCYYSDRFSDLSVAVGSAVYESKWVKYSSLFKTEMMILVERSRRPITLSAGGFSELNLEMFSAIINSAYTYFNIIKAMS